MPALNNITIKRSFKVTNLSEFFKTIIYHILYHSFIIIYNYLSINYLDSSIEIFPDGTYQFEYIKNNIQICQNITYISLLICLLISPTLKLFKISENKFKYDYKLFISLTFIFIKYFYALFDIAVYDREWLKNKESNHLSDTLGTRYTLFIECPYVFVCALIISIALGFVFLTIIYLLLKIFDYICYLTNLINDWAKNITFSYVEYTINDSLEEV